MGLTEAISLGLFLAEAAAKGIAIAQEGKAMVERLKAEGRDPTPEEIASLRAITTRLHEQIQSA
jgi:hypothetical protein